MRSTALCFSLSLCATAALAGCGGDSTATVPTTMLANTTNAWTRQQHPSPSPSPMPTASSKAALSPSLVISRAADFNASMGANLHIESGGPYGNPTTLAAMIVQTGLQHFRDTAEIATGNTSELQSLHTTYGAQFDLVIDPDHPYGSNSAAALEASVATLGVPAIEAGEGVNECDVNIYFCPSGNYGTIESASQQYLYSAMRAESTSIAVYGPSNTTQEAAAIVGNLSAYLDFGVMHDYSSWRPIETAGFGGVFPCGVYGSDSYNICWAGYVSGTKPVVSTETGWGDYGSPDAGINGGDSEGDVPSAVKADYVGRVFAFHWLEGVRRTYYFELADGLSSGGFSAHGLYDVNGAPKPAAFEVANLHSILADTGGSAKTFTPADSIGISVTAPGGAFTVILQKSDGSEYLLYWTGCEEYEGDTYTAEMCTMPTATVSFAHLPSGITNWILNARGGGEATQSSMTPTSSITLTFKPQLQILQLQR